MHKCTLILGVLEGGECSKRMPLGSWVQQQPLGESFQWKQFIRNTSRSLPSKWREQPVIRFKLVHLDRRVAELVRAFFCLMLAVNHMFWSLLTFTSVKVLVTFFPCTVGFSYSSVRKIAKIKVFLFWNGRAVVNLGAPRLNSNLNSEWCFSPHLVSISITLHTY